MIEEGEIDAARWYLLRCRPKDEFKAQAYLERLGYLSLVVIEVLLKKASRHIRGSGQRDAFEVSAMPGLFVVGFARGGPLWSRLMVERERNGGQAPYEIAPVLREAEPGVDYGEDGRAVRVRPDDVRQLLRVQRDPRLRPRESHRHQHRGFEYGPGDPVEVIDGPFQGFRVTVGEIDADGFVTLQFSSGPNARIVVHGESLAKI